MYETGNATGSVDLLTKLEAFMSSNGWTTDSFATEGLGKRFHAHRGSIYFNSRAYNVENPNAALLAGAAGNCSTVAFNIGTGYSGATPWYNQAGVPVGNGGEYMSAGLNGLTASIPAYHFFAHNSGDQILVVVEYASGYFQFFGFGTLTKYGTYTGGEYLFGSMRGLSNTVTIFNSYIPLVGFFSPNPNSQLSPSFINCSVDSETGFHWNNINTGGRDTGKRYVYDNIARFESTLQITPNTLNGLSILQPIQAYVERSTSHGTALRSPLGELPSIFFLKIANLTPGQQITYGSEDYRVFPFYRKNVTTPIVSSTAAGGGHSASYGFAVKEL